MSERKIEITVRLREIDPGVWYEAIVLTGRREAPDPWKGYGPTPAEATMDALAHAGIEDAL